VDNSSLVALSVSGKQIKVHVSSKKSERPRIGLLWVSILAPSTILQMDFGGIIPVV
jgi:hypothetical protein